MVYPEEIFAIKNSIEFNDLAMKVFRWQAKNNEIYKKYLTLINRDEQKIKSIEDIPFLPISFFKRHKIITGSFESKLVFKSSGTTDVNRSHHYLIDPEVYKKSFTLSYKKFIGDPKDQVIIALLPNYIDQGDSSLVFMVNDLMKQTKNGHSVFMLSNLKMLKEVYDQSVNQGKQVVLFGVAYSLMDLCEIQQEFRDSWIIETGGMKGKRKEISKEKLMAVISSSLKPKKIFSEYGMTELSSQAYSFGDDLFQTPNWMKVYISDPDDPFGKYTNNKRGRINIVDLANLYSCSFIQTDDLGINHENGFKLIGRIQNADIRGCNQLIV